MSFSGERSRRALGTLALSLVILVSACVHSAKPPSPDVLPIGRLGRWNGTTFTPVGPASIGSGHLYVLVHGWAAGFQKAVNDYPGPGPLLGWYPQAVNGKGEQFVQVWLAPMAAALSELDPGAVVVAYSWLDQSATSADPLGARISESRTIPNGERLGAALTQAVAPDFRGNGGRVHVLGHSHGAKVATIASLNLDPRPDQLTLFDSVDTAVPLLVGADNHLVPYLQRLHPGRTPGTTFVDNYFSEFGRAYGNEPGLDAIVDTSLDPRQFERTNFMDRHLYPPRWYTAAANQPKAAVGPMWSPLLVDASVVDRLATYYVQAQPGVISKQLVLEPAKRPPPPSVRTFAQHWWPELASGRRPGNARHDRPGDRGLRPEAQASTSASRAVGTQARPIVRGRVSALAPSPAGSSSHGYRLGRVERRIAVAPDRPSRMNGTKSSSGQPGEWAQLAAENGLGEAERVSTV